jgi:hypothetical protein
MATLTQVADLLFFQLRTANFELRQIVHAFFGDLSTGSSSSCFSSYFRVIQSIVNAIANVEIPIRVKTVIQTESPIFPADRISLSSNHPIGNSNYRSKLILKTLYSALSSSTSLSRRPEHCLSWILLRDEPTRNRPGKRQRVGS